MSNKALDLEIKRKELEVKRVLYHRDDMLFQIEEKKAEIERIQNEIQIQEKRAEELSAQITKLKGE